MSENINDRTTPYYIISIEVNCAHGQRQIMGFQSPTKKEGFVSIPDDLAESILETGGWCDIELNAEGTEVVSFTALEKPEIPEPVAEPTAQEDLMAMAIEHEYRLTLLELGIAEEV